MRVNFSDPGMATRGRNFDLAQRRSTCSATAADITDGGGDGLETWEHNMRLWSHDHKRRELTKWRRQIRYSELFIGLRVCSFCCSLESGWS
jgi:hypothetical protein